MTKNEFQKYLDNSTWAIMQALLRGTPLRDAMFPVINGAVNMGYLMAQKDEKKNKKK